MGVAISSEVLTAIRAAAAADPGREICGLLLGTPGRIDTAQPCANIADDAARRFEIDPAALFAAHRAARAGGPGVIGCYHSHPTGIAVPSVCDAASAMGDKAVWLIVAGGAVRAWRTVEIGRFEEVDLMLAATADPLSPRP